jgi:hypothetical protein
MTEIYKIEVIKNLVTRTVTEHNGRDSDELHEFVQVHKISQEGWKVILSIGKYDWSDTEKDFEDSIKKAYSVLKYGIKLNIPYSVEVHTHLKYELLDEQIFEQDELEFEEEKVFIQIRQGMSVNIFAHGKYVILSAPVKGNRSGDTVRGYACTMESCPEKMKDIEFYKELLKKLNILK